MRNRPFFLPGAGPAGMVFNSLFYALKRLQPFSHINEKFYSPKNFFLRNFALFLSRSAQFIQPYRQICKNVLTKMASSHPPFGV
jgi:hypothetical protein